MPVFFHNRHILQLPRGYNCHHLIHGLSKYNYTRISCIATTSERYVSVSPGRWSFVDSFLDTFVENLLKDGSRFPVFRQRIDTHVDLLVRKDVYPYEFVDSVVRFDKAIQSASERYANKLTEFTATDIVYVHGRNVWTAFNMCRFSEYLDMYRLLLHVRTDVLLLADVFERF